MKKILSLAVFMFVVTVSLSSFAKWQRLSDESWHDIASNKNIEISWPAIRVGSVVTTINNVCSTGMGLRTLHPVKQCVATEVVSRKVCRTYGEFSQCHDVPSNYVPKKYEDYREETKCAQFDMVSGMTETRQFMVNRCVDKNGKDAMDYGHGEGSHEPRCTGEYKDVVAEIPLVYSVALIKADSYYTEQGMQVLDYKTFDISKNPHCAAH